MPRKALALLMVSALLAPDGAAAATGERWRRPLPGGAVVGSFTYERAAPYMRGRRRGIDFRGEPGAAVLASCGGTVAYAGRVPGWGRGVTLRCAGGLVATELGLSSARVARAARVPAGTVLGWLGERGVLRLGARVAADRQGYVDPAALLGDADRPEVPTLAPSPPPRVVRPASRRATPPRVVRPPVDVAGGAPLPAPVLAGLALLAVGLAGGTRARRWRARRLQPGIAVAQR